MGHDDSPVIIEQSIDNFEGTKSINVNASEGMSDVEAGIQFIYDIKYHTTDIALSLIHI